LSPERRSSDLRRALLRGFRADEKSVLLLYVGRLVPEKNLQLLFDALAHLNQNGRRNLCLLVAGDGIERPRWAADTAHTMPGKVKFLGHIAGRDELADLYANSDVFIHPNPNEPFGIAPLEAMASGLPLVAPNSGGVTSYANDRNAWLSEPTVSGFAAAVEQAFLDEAGKVAKIRAALETAREYEWGRVASSFLDLYSEIHCSAVSKSQVAPVFWSTAATGPRQFVVRAVAGTAEKIFKLLRHNDSSPSKCLQTKSRSLSRL
jgi:1,2-diacylglycerol 3-alpha-glucosyltransferase